MREKIAFVFSTKDRPALSRMSLTSMDTEGPFDVIWVDGSDSSEGRQLPYTFRPKNFRIVEIQKDIKGGPDNAIILGLKRLIRLGYDYCGLIENDIVFREGWLGEIIRLMTTVREQGYEVGAATLRNLESRVLFYRSDYTINWNTGAGMILFTRKAAKLILLNYRARRAREIAQYFETQTAADLREVWELWLGKDDRQLGYDWSYSLELLRHGLISVGSIPSMAQNVDCDLDSEMHTRYVTHSIATCDRVIPRVTRPILSKQSLSYFAAYLPSSAFLTLLATIQMSDRVLSFLKKPWGRKLDSIKSRWRGLRHWFQTRVAH